MKVKLTKSVVVFAVLVGAEAETLTESNVAIVLLIGLEINRLRQTDNGDDDNVKSSSL